MMMERSRSLSLSVLLVSLGLLALVAGPASATTVYGNYSGATMDFLGVQETSTFGDPEPLFEAPIVIGDSLFFSPSSYLATAAGAGGFDQTGALLEMTLAATSGNYIETVTITEAGDTFLVGGGGTAATGAFVGVSGFITVTGANGAPIAPVIIPYTAIFTQDTFALPGDFGNTTWVGTAIVDVASVVPNATEAVFDLDNNLYAYSEAGTSSLIQKKVANALVISLPEPTSVALMGLGLVAAAFAGRRRTR
jgi:hypothetical protein